MKKYFYFAAALLTLASCANDDFVGENEEGAYGQKAISFNSGKQTVTRADAGLETVTGTFNVYGVKGAGDQVFNNYAVWHANDVSSTTRPSYWEYVGNGSVTPYTGTEGSGTAGTAINTNGDQTIKYWDYSAANYMFWAIAPYDKTNVKFHKTAGATAEPGNNDDGDIVEASISNIGGHLVANTGSTAKTYGEYYIAKPVTVLKADYGTTPVSFTFERNSAKVRVGVYETIPGYSVQSISFYQGSATTANTNGNIVLNRTDDGFVGNTTAGTAGTMTVTYTNDHANNANNAYSVSYGTGMTAQAWWQGGALPYETTASNLKASNTKVLATTSTEATKLYGTDGDLGTNNYFTVLPTPTACTGSNAKPITIKCDYTLVSLDAKSDEVIHVTGATATIPAAYTTWLTNHAYTYLFKISDNTNGSTGTAGTDAAGLYPITLDAVITDVSDGTDGYVSTVSTLSVTASQPGTTSDYVTTDGIIFQTGTAITLKVMSGTDDVTSASTITGGYVSSYDYTKTPEQNLATFGSLTSTLAAQSTDGYWVLKVVKDPATTYVVLHVGAADDK